MNIDRFGRDANFDVWKVEGLTFSVVGSDLDILFVFANFVWDRVIGFVFGGLEVCVFICIFVLGIL